MTKINKLMTSDLQYCTVLDNVYEVMVKMKDADVGAIPIVDEDGATLVGIVTDRISYYGNCFKSRTLKK